LRYHRHLQPACCVEFLLQPGEMSVDLVPQALLLERRAEAGFQQNRIEGFEQIIDGAEFDATGHAVHLGEGRDHDHGEIAQPRLILQPGEHLKAVDFRHHHVEEDEVEGGRLDERNRFLAVARGLDVGVAFEIEMKLQRIAVVVVVIDDKDAGPSSHRSIVGHRAVPINAGNGTLASSEAPCSAFPPANRYCTAEGNRAPPGR